MLAVYVIREARTYVVRQFLRSLSLLWNLTRFVLLKRHRASEKLAAFISTLDAGGSRFLRR